MTMNEPDDKKNTENEGGFASHTPHDIAKPGEYLRAVKAHLQKGDQKEAFGLLQQAALHYPNDPFILSYYGCLQAQVDRKYLVGVDKCKQALSKILKESWFGENMLFPVFYLNLGRAYVAAGKKKEALEVFGKGLRYDSRNHDILMEIRGLGSRKKAPMSFLDRSHPINKYIGLILHKTDKAPDKQR
jgi:tetratricopeptide (TPR) repeat protein